MKVTAVGDVITTVVAALDAAVTYPVFDGPLTARPKRIVAQFACIGAEEPWLDEDGNPTNSGDMSQVWKGLGQVARDESLHIPCVAVGKANTVAAARALAIAVMQDVFNNMGIKPTSDTYNALISDIPNMDARAMAGGAVVTLKFVLSADARLR